MFIVCCVKSLLLVQGEFKKQKWKIEKFITNSANDKHLIMMYYPKYHCKLSHIEHFWFVPKNGFVKIATIHLMIYNDVFFVHQQVYPIIPLLPISVFADGKGFFTVKGLGMALCNRKHVQQRIINLQMKVMMVLRGKMAIALMATRTSELKQRCLSHVSRVNPIRQLSPIAKQLWFSYATFINDAVRHQLIVCLGVAKSFASARTWTRIAIFIKCLSTEQAQLSHRRHWAS